jgi:hypothetical protein
MSERDHLPDRRGADLVASVHEGLRSTASIGRFACGAALSSTLRNGKENGKAGKETGKSKQELAKAELLRLLLSCAEKCYGRRQDATRWQKIDKL